MLHACMRSTSRLLYVYLTIYIIYYVNLLSIYNNISAAEFYCAFVVLSARTHRKRGKKSPHCIITLNHENDTRASFSPVCERCYDESRVPIIIDFYQFLLELCRPPLPFSIPLRSLLSLSLLYFHVPTIASFMYLYLHVHLGFIFTFFARIDLVHIHVCACGCLFRWLIDYRLVIHIILRDALPSLTLRSPMYCKSIW